MLGRRAGRQLLGAWRATSAAAGRSMMSDWVAVNGMYGSPYTRNRVVQEIGSHGKEIKITTVNTRYTQFSLIRDTL